MKCSEYAMEQEHIMDFTRLRALGSLFSMFKQAVRNVITYNQQHSDFPMEVLHALCVLYNLGSRVYPDLDK